jgi:enamine deaminase RidA (YjgF/YER057c/UK114 family)
MTPLEQLDLPEAPAPVGRYERGIIHDGIGFLSGQFPLVEGKLLIRGRVGHELTVEQGRQAAEAAALNVLAQLRTVTVSEARAFAGLLRVDGFVASADHFTDQPAVLDAASALFLDQLGDLGRHARTAFAVSRLPLDAPIELVVTFAVAKT